MSLYLAAGGLLNRLLNSLLNSEVDLTAEPTGLSTGWQLFIGSAAGLVLVLLAFVIGGWVQRRSVVRDEARKAELRADADKNGTQPKVLYTEIDLTDTDDFDVPTPAGQPN